MRTPDVKSTGATPPSSVGLSDAQRVVVIVHGVGDHTAADIAREVVVGAYAEEHRATTLQLLDLPFPKALYPLWRGSSANSGEAVRIEHSAGIDVVLPVVWSSFRIRGEAPR